MAHTVAYDTECDISLIVPILWVELMLFSVTDVELTLSAVRIESSRHSDATVDMTHVVLMLEGNRFATATLRTGQSGRRIDSHGVAGRVA